MLDTATEPPPLPPLPPPHPYPGRDPRSVRAAILLFLKVVGVAVAMSAVYLASWTIGHALDRRDGGERGFGVATGLLLLLTGVIWWVRRRRRKLGPEPWKRDRKWPLGGESRISFTRTFHLGVRVGCAVAAGLAASQFLSIGTVSACFLGVAAYFVVAAIGYLRLRLQGGVEIRWREFPMRTGTRVVIDVGLRGGAAASAVAATIRCVETRLVGPNRVAATRVVAEVRPERSAPTTIAAGEFVALEFQLPAECPGTDLSRRGKETHWELVVRAATPSGGISKQFLLPVYAGEAASAGTAAPVLTESGSAESQPEGRRAHEAGKSTWPWNDAERWRAPGAASTAVIVWLALLEVSAVLAVTSIGASARATEARWVAACAAVLCFAAAFFARARGRREERRAAGWSRGGAWARGVGAPARSDGSMISPGVGGAFLMLGPVGVVIAGRADSTAVVSIVGIVCVATALALLAIAAWERRWRVEVKWADSWFPTGSRVRVSTRFDAGLGEVRAVQAALRAVRSPPSADPAFPTPAEVACVAQPGVLTGAVGADGEYVFEFDVPADAPGSDFSRPGAALHWEFIVLATTARGEIAERVIAPVFAAESGLPLPSADPAALIADTEPVTLREAPERLAAWLGCVKPAAVFGLVLAAAGLGIGEGPGVVLALAFWIACVAIAAVGRASLRRRRAAAAAKPWTCDRTWGRRGVTRGAIARGFTFRGLRYGALYAAILLFFSGPDDRVGTAQLVAVAFLTLLIFFAYLHWIAGRVHVSWDEFPMRTGRRLRFGVTAFPRVEGHYMAAGMLRVVEARRLPGASEPSGVVVAEYPTVARGFQVSPAGSTTALEFDVPGDAPGTDLSRAGEERHWELVVFLGPAHAGERFVVPVYATDGAPSARTENPDCSASGGVRLVPRVEPNGAGPLPGSRTGTSIASALIAMAVTVAVPLSIGLSLVLTAIVTQTGPAVPPVEAWVTAILAICLGGAAAYFGVRSILRRRRRSSEFRAATQGSASGVARRGLLTRRICSGFWTVGLFVMIAGCVAVFEPMFRIGFACGLIVVTIVVARLWLQGGLEILAPKDGLQAGRRGTVEVSGVGGPGAYNSIDIALRCLVRPKGVRTDADVTEVCRFEATLPGPLDVSPEEPLIVGFDLPADAMASESHGSIEVDWQLVVAPQTEWGRFVEWFDLVVVPAPSGAEPASEPRASQAV